MEEKDNENISKNNKHSRRSFLGGSFVAVVGGLLAGMPKKVEAAENPPTGMVAWLQPGNNNHLIQVQEKGSSSVSGTVQLEYFGHCAFRLTSPGGVTMIVDPWRNDPSGYWGIWYPKDFPKITADIGLSTHAHFDHDALDKIIAYMLLDRMVGEFVFGDVKITGIADKHACSAPGWYKWTDAIREFGANPCPPDNPHHMDMSMYLIETGGLKIVMWGDNRHNPSPKALEMLGEIDVLTLPVDGSQHILSYDQGNELVKELNPKVVIPTHYLCEGVSSTLSTLQNADEWVKSQKNKTNLKSGVLKLEKGDVAQMRQEFMYFGSNTAIPS